LEYNDALSSWQGSVWCFQIRQQGKTMTRPSNRSNDQMRDIQIDLNVTKHAEGSCMIKCGDTHVLCTASVEENVPRWMKGTGKGWVTAEYGMLPRSTHSRMDREAARGKQSGRTQEIQRLIGRSLRAVVDMKKLGERQIKIDCDVIQADGGTRTASITGGYVAMMMAVKHLMSIGLLSESPVVDSIAAISCGLYKGEAVLDLDYIEDSNAEADANFVLTGKGGIVEIQATAEEFSFTDDQFAELMRLAKKGCGELAEKQKVALK
jgi:ribonuclease PH